MPFDSQGQEYSYIHYTPNDGLVQTQIMCFHQDSKGFIWLGTKGGISRFDGLQFKNYTVNDGLPSNSIYFLTEDKSGNIIALTQNGISYFIGEKIYNFYSKIKEFTYNNLYSVNQTGTQEWEFVYFTDSVFHYAHFKNGVFSSDETKNETLKAFKYDDYPIRDFLKINYPSNTLYFAKNNTLLKLNNGNITKEIETHSKIRRISYGDDNNIYILINDTLYRYQNKKLLFFNKLPLITDERLGSIKIDKKGNIYFIDKDNHLHIGNQIDNFKHSSLNSCVVDKEEALWLWGEEGLFKLQSQLFTNYIPGKCAINNNVWCISEDKKHKLYFGSFEGNIVKLDKGKFENIDLKKKAFPYPDYLHFYMGSSIDKEKNIYFAMSKLYHFDGNVFKKIEIENEDKIYSSLYTFIDTLNGKLLAGTNMGLIIKEKNKKGKVYKIYPGNEKKRNIVSIIKDKLGRYWLGGFRKISIIDKNKVIHFPNKDFNFNYGGNTMYVDYKGNIWIGNEKGLFLYDYKSFKKINNPYFNSITGFITEIDKKHFLIGSMNNLGVFFIDNYYITGQAFIKLYDKYNGFWGSECGQNGAFKDSKGLIWIPAADRVVKFEPSFKVINRIQPKIFVDRLSIIDDKMHKNAINENFNNSTEVKLKYNQNNLQIDYLAISTTAPERVRYKYYLEGNDNVWSEATSLRFVIYTNLAPGKYTFYLKACNEDNIWTDIPHALNIEIEKAFWQTIWFKILIISITICLTILITYLFLLQKKKKEFINIRNEKKITELQFNTIKGQMDPHFTFNVINSIASVIYKEDKENAIKIFNKFSNLLRIVINSSNDTYRTINEEILFVTNYLEIEKFRFKDKFEFTLTINKDVDKQKYIPKMVIQTHVENAIKHGLMHREKNGKLDISIFCNTTENIITIEDNGIGRVKSKTLSHHSTGKGLKIINSYFELFNKYNKDKITQEIVDLYDIKNNPTGTIIIIKIPLNFNFKI